jgi:hypothetical protein
MLSAGISRLRAAFIVADIIFPDNVILLSLKSLALLADSNLAAELIVVNNSSADGASTKATVCS